MAERVGKDHQLVHVQRRVAGARAQRRVSRVLQATVRTGGRIAVKVLITGAGGMVGRTLAQFCAASGDEVAAYDHQSLDIADEESVMAAFERDRPEAVFNCAAWTDVDGCEEEWERAMRVNARGPQILAVGCRRVGASLLTISTDYVFDGDK